MPNIPNSPANKICLSNGGTKNIGHELNGLPPMFRGYAITLIQYCNRKPESPPRIPPVSTTSGTADLWNPMASLASSIGNGLYASISRYPSAYAALQAFTSSVGVSNSATNP